MLFDCESPSDVRQGIQSFCHLGSHYQSEITSESEAVIQIPGPRFLCRRKLPVGFHMPAPIFQSTSNNISQLGGSAGGTLNQPDLFHWLEIFIIY